MRKKLIMGCFLSLWLLTTVSVMAAPKPDHTLLVADRSFEDVWNKVLKGLENYPLAIIDQQKGMIQSQGISVKPQGIMALEYVDEHQEFTITIREEKPSIISLAVNVKVIRKNRKGQRMTVQNTEDYARLILKIMSEGISNKMDLIPYEIQK
jgi:hypothetical protein